MAATMYHEEDADLSIIQGRKVAIIGYGSQGHAHALNLRDSGVDVRVGLKDGSPSRAKAEAEGLRVTSVAEAVKESTVIMILAPDHLQRHIYTDSILPNLKDGDALFFSRDLMVSGDVGAALALRNAIDDAELDLLEEVSDLAPPIARPLRSLAAMVERRTDVALHRVAEGL